MDDRLRSVASDRSGGVARVSRLKLLKSGLGIASFLVILLPVKYCTLVVRVVIPVDATMNVGELVEVASNISTMGLVDFLVDVRVGVAWLLIGVDDIVAPQLPLKIGATSPKSTPVRLLRYEPPWPDRLV